MNLNRITILTPARYLLAIIFVLVSSCMKLDYSPLQESGPVLALLSSKTQYRYHVRIDSAGAGHDIKIFTDVECSNIAPNTTATGTQQAFGTEELYSYQDIKPGNYFVGETYQTPCEPFTAIANESYTINIYNDQMGYTLSITSP